MYYGFWGLAENGSWYYPPVVKSAMSLIYESKDGIQIFRRV